ncbi:MAG: hypothetical protein ACO25B_00570 [Chitinophagaceae bacterium]
MERGWDPDVKKYLRKVIGTVSWGLFWLIGCVTGGLYYELGYPAGKPLIWTFLFYAAALAGLFLLVRFLQRTWKE